MFYFYYYSVNFYVAVELTVMQMMTTVGVQTYTDLYFPSIQIKFFWT